MSRCTIFVLNRLQEHTCNGAFQLLGVPLALLSIVAFAWQPAYAQHLDVGAGSPDWPMSGHNPAGTRWNRSAKEIRPPLRKLWSRSLPNYSADGLSATGELILLSGNGWSQTQPNRVIALNGNGGDLWSYTLFTGTGSMQVAPAIQSGMAFFGGQHDDKLYAVNGRTGQTLWTLPGVETMYASPPVVYGDEVYAFAKNDVRAVSVANGAVRWATAAAGWAGNLAIWGNSVVALSWSTPPVALDRTTGRALWRRADLSTHFSNAIAHEGRAYFGGRGGRVFALDLADGRTVWSARMPVRLNFSEVEDYTAALANGVLYVAGGVRATERSPTPQKVLVAFDASTGSVLWQTGVAEDWSGPIVANSVVYVNLRRSLFPAQNWLLAFDAVTGRNLWQVAADDVVAVANERLYLLSNQPSHLGTSTVSAYVTEHTGPPRYPVLFVHGINSDGATWSDFKERLKAAGLTYGGNARVATGTVENDNAEIGSRRLAAGDFYTLDFSSNNDLSYQEQGWELAKIIAEIVRINDSGRVVIVAHSMGGLASRTYLQGQAMSRGGDRLAYRGDVNHLIMLGTPHLGSPAPIICQDVVLLRVLCLTLGGASKAMSMLRPASPELQQLNSTVTSLPQIGYSSLVVRGTSLDLFGLNEDGDGIVSTSSQNFASISLPPHVAPHHALLELDLDPSKCFPGGVQSHGCETGSSAVQDAVIGQAHQSRISGVAPSPGAEIGISTFASRPLHSRMLSVTVRPIGEIQSHGAALFIVAIVGNQYFALTPRGWVAWASGVLPEYQASLASSQTIELFNGAEDLSPFAGSQIYVGYGHDASEMLKSARYALVHTLR